MRGASDAPSSLLILAECRILVMREGRIAAELTRDEATEERNMDDCTREAA